MKRVIPSMSLILCLTGCGSLIKDSHQDVYVHGEVDYNVNINTCGIYKDDDAARAECDKVLTKLFKDLDAAKQTQGDEK